MPEETQKFEAPVDRIGLGTGAADMDRRAVGPKYRFGVIEKERRTQLFRLLTDEASGGELMAFLAIEIYKIAPGSVALMMGMESQRLRDVLGSAYRRAKLHGDEQSRRRELARLWAGNESRKRR